MATVDLSWSHDDGSDPEDGFYIYKSTTSSPSFPSDYSQIGTNGADNTTYTDSNAPDGQTVYYAVTAYNSAGESSADTTSIETITSPSITGTLSSTVSGEDIILDLPSVDWGGEVGDWEIYKGESSGSHTLHTTISGSSTSYTDVDPQNGTRFYYVVVATNSVGSSNESNETNSRVPYSHSRSTTLSADGAVSATRVSMTKTRTSIQSGDGTLTSTRVASKPRSTTLSSDGTITATRSPQTKGRSSTISGDGRVTTYASFQKAFRATRYLSFEYSSTYSGFVSEWFYEDKVHPRNSVVGAYTEGWIGDDFVQIKVEYVDGERSSPPTNYTEDETMIDEQSGVRYLTAADRVETFKEMSGGDGWYRVILRYLRLDDNVVEVNLGLTHS